MKFLKKEVSEMKKKILRTVKEIAYIGIWVFAIGFAMLVFKHDNTAELIMGICGLSCLAFMAGTETALYLRNRRHLHR